MQKLATLIGTLFIAVFLYSTSSFAHCEVPCGIYDDKARTTEIAEHIATIEKAIKSIDKEKQAGNDNQVVRWVLNKEKHAEELQHIVYQYFMTQRIKFDTEMYNEKLAALHQLLVYAMKAKQSMDLANVESLKKSLMAFEELYFAGK